MKCVWHEGDISERWVEAHIIYFLQSVEIGGRANIMTGENKIQRLLSFAEEGLVEHASTKLRCLAYYREKSALMKERDGIQTN
jgi:hypothetical protein